MRAASALALLAIGVAGCATSSAHRSVALPSESTAPSSIVTSTTSASSAPQAPRLDRIAFLDPGHGYGLFEQAQGPTCRGLVGRSNDAGAHFGPLVEVDSWPCGGYPPAGRLAFDDRGDGFAYGPDLFVTHDGGRSWIHDPVRKGVVSVEALGASVWISQARCSGAISSQRCASVISASTDGGRSWVPLTDQPSPALRGPAQQASPESAVGQTWLVRTSPAVAYVLGPPDTDPAGEPDSAPLGKTTDGGRSWTAERIPCHLDALSVVMSAAPDGSLWAVCAGQPSAGSQLKSIQVSPDGGRTWQLRASCQLPDTTSSQANCVGSPPDNGYLSDIDAVSATTAYMVGGRLPLSVSRDGGSTWASPQQTLIGDTSGGSDQVIFFDASHGITLADDENNNEQPTLWTTDDAGYTWHRNVPVVS